MRLYLAGPMRSRPSFNKDMFDAEAMRLRRAGYEVISPVELDEEAGWDLETMSEADLPDDWRTQVAVRDARAIASSDGIALLPDWSESAGVEMEMAVGRFMGIPIKEVEAWLLDAAVVEEHSHDE